MFFDSASRQDADRKSLSPEGLRQVASPVRLPDAFLSLMCSDLPGAGHIDPRRLSECTASAGSQHALCRTQVVSGLAEDRKNGLRTI